MFLTFIEKKSVHIKIETMLHMDIYCNINFYDDCTLSMFKNILTNSKYHSWKIYFYLLISSP